MERIRFPCAELPKTLRSYVPDPRASFRIHGVYVKLSDWSNPTAPPAGCSATCMSPWASLNSSVERYSIQNPRSGASRTSRVLALFRRNVLVFLAMS